MKEKELFSVYDIAYMFNVSPVTIYKWIEKGLPSTKEAMTGTKTRQMIYKEDVERYISEVQNG